jgi:hypothetical protein
MDLKCRWQPVDMLRAADAGDVLADLHTLPELTSEDAAADDVPVAVS